MNGNITRPHFVRLIWAAYQLSMNLLCLKKVKAVSTHLQSSNCVSGPRQSASGTKTRKRPCAVRKGRNDQVGAEGVVGETSQRRQSISVWWSTLVNINRGRKGDPIQSRGNKPAKEDYWCQTALVPKYIIATSKEKWMKKERKKDLRLSTLTYKTVR